MYFPLEENNAMCEPKRGHRRFKTPAGAESSTCYLGFKQEDLFEMAEGLPDVGLLYTMQQDMTEVENREEDTIGG